uniref:Vacuolar integral membrane protein YDR352W n=1 Tax=Anthurium amnicola TaxID=1678845 RepID=A0A1D1YJG6_9ARAE
MSDGCNSDGIAHIQWINTIFGSCISDNQEAFSVILGYLTLVCWLNAQLPQLITNYRNKSVEGLSLPFLLNWLLGDITNFLGGILTDQLKFQIYLAAYFCIVDFILFFQYFYYTWYQISTIVEPGEDIPVRPLSTQSFKDSILEGARKSYTFPTRKNQSHQRLSSMVFAVLLFTFHSTSSISSSFSTSPSYLSTAHDDEMSFSGHAKLFFERNSESIGRILAWICTVLYLTSRMPQIWKNYTRRSVEGLSIFMFIFAALGNLSYSTSIFINPSLGTDPKYLRKEVPYILGSIGTLAFDVTILIQWCIFRDPEHRHRKRRSRHSVSYGSDNIGYYQLPTTDDESYSRRSGQIDGGNFV